MITAKYEFSMGLYINNIKVVKGGQVKANICYKGGKSQ